LFSSEEAEEHRILAAVHSRPAAEEGNHPAVEEERHIAAEEGILAADCRSRLAVDRRSLEEHQGEEQTGSDHRSRLAAEEGRRSWELHPEDGSISRPWCRTRDRLHRGLASESVAESQSQFTI
jgi:hypothetical protein